MVGGMPTEGDQRQPRLTDWLDDRRVDELLGGLTDAEREREIVEFIAERRRATHDQLDELITALRAARADAEKARRDRDDLQVQVDQLQDRVFQAESEAAALRRVQPLSRSVVSAARWASGIGRNLGRGGR